MDPGLLNLLAQLGCLIAAAILGRFRLRSRLAIFGVAVAGAFAAMVAHILYDGQGAVAMVIFVPIIYVVATVGRWDLGT